MTDQTTAELIAKTKCYNSDDAPLLIDRLVDALEAAEQRVCAMEDLRDRWLSVVSADGFEAAVDAEAHAYHESECRYRVERDAAIKRAEEAERDLEELSDDLDHHVKGHMAEYERAAALAAVVEKVRVRLTTDLDANDESHVSDALTILDSAPADALREVKAAAWDEGSDLGFTHGMSYQAGNNSAMNYRNPYRKEQGDAS